MKFQIVKRGGRSLTKETISLDEFANNIRNGVYDMPKTKIPGIVLNQFNGKRRYTHLVGLSGWLAFDIDHLDKQYPNCNTRKVAEFLRDMIFKDKHIKLAFVSTSGKGVKAIGYWPPMKVNPKYFVDYDPDCEECWNPKDKLLQMYYKRIHGLRQHIDYFVNVKFDLIVRVPTQVVFGSIDKEVKFKL